MEEIDAFVQCLEQQLVILQATVQQKEHFMKLVEESPVLKLVEMSDWAGRFYILNCINIIILNANV